jgi:protein required for attachment to host cells
MLTPNKTTWVLVADESMATLYERSSRRGPLKELFQLTNESERKKTAELISDRGGRAFDSHGQGRHTMTREKSGPKRHAAQAFAKVISLRIVAAIHKGSCDDVALIAAPRFLGLLRDALAKAGNVVPKVTIDKEMVGQDTAAIERLLEAHS